MTAKKDTKRKALPDALEAKLLVESRNTCNLCWKSREVQIHHIVAVELGGSNEEENLIVVCLNCHSEAHTKKAMAQNLKPQTLRLYKETWIDLLRRYPLGTQGLADEENDIKIIQQVLKQAYRRALYFPFDLESPDAMFGSINDLRIFLQSAGFKLIKSQQAREHACLLFKALVEISCFEPRRARDYYCLFELGRDTISLLELRRKTARFHLNELAKLVGAREDMFAEDEFAHMGFDIPKHRRGDKRCFANFDDSSSQCASCEFKAECVEASL